MYLISYTALSDNITAEGRQRGTTTVEYFTKQSVKVKKDKDTPSEDWHDSRVLYFWNRLTKQNRESKWKTEGCEAEGASTRYLLTWWKVHFSGRWQEIDEENKRKYDNMTEQREHILRLDTEVMKYTNTYMDTQTGAGTHTNTDFKGHQQVWLPRRQLTINKRKKDNEAISKKAVIWIPPPPLFGVFCSLRDEKTWWFQLTFKWHRQYK